MKNFGAAMIAASLIAANANASTFTLSSPAITEMDNAGTCLNPVLVPNPSGTVTFHVRVLNGTVAVLEDSVAVTAGAPFSLTRSVPAGIYNFDCWLSDQGGAGCDTMMTFRVKGPRWKRPLTVK
jgi:hypothetical protein